MNAGIIVAAGKSERMGPLVDKAFLSLGTKPVLAYSLQAYEKCPEIDMVILVVRKDRIEAAHGVCQIFGCSKVQQIVAGGASRQVSVARGLSEIPEEVDIVSIHDGARPLVTPILISDTIKVAKRYGAGVTASKVTDTIKLVEKGTTVSKTIDRTHLWAAQTPQSFNRELLLKAYATVKKKHLTVTDDAAAVELVSKKVHLVSTTLPNVKVTTPDDLTVAAALLKL